MPAVTYWTGTWDPQREAISKEIDLLRRRDGGLRPVVSFSSGNTSALEPGHRVLRLTSRQWPLMRGLAPLVEWSGDVTHVFGGLNSWHLLRCIGRRPTILTVSLSGGPLANGANVGMFAAESEALAEELRDRGIAGDRVRLIYPGVDLDQYRPAPVALPEPFRVLFASSPADAEEFDVRGIPLLVETARACPDMTFVFLWRSWGDQDAARRAFERLAPPANVRIECCDAPDMAEVYRHAHAIACFYADGFGKSCPNSVVEALACGVPALVADTTGIAPLVAGCGAGIACVRRVREIAAAARAIRARHVSFSRAARELAERTFGAREFLSSYARLYDEVCGAVRSRAA